MAFYADFSGHYEKIFPVREATFKFLDRWLSEEGRHLDLGCGTGGYCGQLTKKGRDVLGLDLDPGMIAQAEEKHPQTTFRIMDLQEISGLQPESFSGVYCIGNVLPHLPSQDLPSFLRSVKRLLKPGGHWIFQTVNFDPLLHFEAYEFPVLKFPEGDLEFFRNYTHTSRGTTLFRTQLMCQGEEVFAGETTLYPQNSADYLALNEKTGFNLLGHYSDFQGGPYAIGRFSASIYVFEKPEKKSE